VAPWGDDEPPPPGDHDAPPPHSRGPDASPPPGWDEPPPHDDHDAPPPVGMDGPPPGARPTALRAVPLPPEGAPKGPIWLQLDDAFAHFVGEVRRRRPALAANLVHVRPLAFGVDGVVLGCETAFDEGKLNDRETHDALSAMLGDHFRRPVRLVVQRGFELASTAPRTLAEVEDEHQAAVRVAKEQAARDNPAVRAVVGTLGGAIANVRVLDEG